ncbi:MAG: rod shape-determining protein MreC [Fibrobacterota bacterium]
MHWLIAFILSHKSGSSLFVTVLISLMLINSGRTEQKRITGILTTIFFPVEMVVNNSNKIRNLFEENQKLNQKISVLQVENASLQNALVMDSLKTDFRELSEEIPYNLLQAEVISYEPVPIHRTITINKGRSDGVKQNMPVINFEGVIGKVSMVLSNCSRVQLIRMPDEKLSVLHERSGSVGILKSNDGKNLTVNMITQKNIFPGDTIVTSGLGGVYPPQLPLGTVSDISEAQNPLYKNISVSSFADLNNLRFVNIITLENKWTSYKTELDFLDE